MAITVADRQKMPEKEFKLLTQGRGVKLALIMDCWICSSITERWSI
jgi:hypothetical protein